MSCESSVEAAHRAGTMGSVMRAEAVGRKVRQEPDNRMAAHDPRASTRVAPPEPAALRLPSAAQPLVVTRWDKAVRDLTERSDRGNKSSQTLQ